MLFPYMQRSRSVKRRKVMSYIHLLQNRATPWHSKCQHSSASEGEEETDKQVCVAYFGAERTSEE